MSILLNQTKEVAMCSSEDRMRCYQLMLEEFKGMSLGQFLLDFEEKQYVMLLVDQNEGIVGFSTLMVLDIELPGKPLKIIFSGDTTVLRKHRDSVGFGIELVKFFTDTTVRFPDHEIYYALISKGWRTYRVLPFYFKRFVPCHNTVMNNREKMIMDTFGHAKYPDNYDAKHGLIRFNGETQRLRSDSPDAEVPSRSNAHIDYFFKKNPQYLTGTELVCIAEVAHQNFTNAIMRFTSVNEKTKEVL